MGEADDTFPSDSAPESGLAGGQGDQISMEPKLSDVRQREHPLREYEVGTLGASVVDPGVRCKMEVAITRRVEPLPSFYRGLSADQEIGSLGPK